MKNDSLKAREKPIAIGEAAPDFTLLDQNRKEWHLAEAVKQGDVVLCFFPLAFTGVCGIEMRCVTSDMAAWKAKGAQVVGVSCDSFATLKAWADAEGFTHTLLADMHRQVCRAYGLYWPELNVSARGTVVIGRSPDGKGTVKWVETREPKTAMDWNSVLAMIS
jgi:peroxiredoxin